MTINQIKELLRAHGHEATVRDLELAIDNEARALLRAAPIRRRIPETTREKAADFYAEDITRELEEPSALTQDDVLYVRRKPTAWAIAERLRALKAGGAS